MRKSSNCSWAKVLDLTVTVGNRHSKSSLNFGRYSGKGKNVKALSEESRLIEVSHDIAAYNLQVAVMKAESMCTSLQQDG